MLARGRTDLITGLVFLAFALVIVNIIVPDFILNVVTFVTNQWAIVVASSLAAFLVAILQRKISRESRRNISNRD
jgi:membrane protein implicated in regulation of membrane protease activity